VGFFDEPVIQRSYDGGCKSITFSSFVQAIQHPVMVLIKTSQLRLAFFLTNDK
jgi:hypothetical protein